MTEQKNLQNPNGAAGLLAAIPYLVGFMPHNSLVLVAISLKTNRVQLAIRIDLVGFQTDELLVKAEQALINAKANAQIDLILPVIYADSKWVNYRELISRLTKAQSENFEVRDGLWVNQSRYGSVLCENPECCPPDGYELASDSSKELFQLIAQGRAAMGNRNEILDFFTAKKANPKILVNLAKLNKAKSRAKSEAWEINLYNRVLVNLLHKDPKLNELAQAELILVTEEIALRDRLISEILNEVKNSQDALNLLNQIKLKTLDLVQSAPEDKAKGVLTLVGLWHWQMGEAVWAEAAVNQALKLDPQYRLALLTLNALRSGLPPWRFADCFVPIS